MKQWVLVDQPLDLAKSLQSGQAFRWRQEGGGWSGFIGPDPVTLRQGSGGLEVEGTEGRPGALAGAVARYLRLDDDLPGIYRRLCQDPHLAGAVRGHRGLRILRQDPWECLVAFICSASSSIERISHTQEALAEAVGSPVSPWRPARRAFPGPRAVAEAGEGALRRLGLGFRAPYVAGAAEAVASGRLPLDALRDAPYGEAREALLGLRGVGEKVADCVLLFSLEKLESFPIDRWVRRAVEEAYFGGTRLPYRDVAAWARDTFGAAAGYAQQYLFYGRRWGTA